MAYTNYLYHHGIKGQKWGVRRYQNDDGSYTEVGKQRIQKSNYKTLKKSYARNQRNSTTSNTHFLNDVTEAVRADKQITNKYSKEIQNLNKTNQQFRKAYEKWQNTEFNNDAEEDEAFDNLIKLQTKLEKGSLDLGGKVTKDLLGQYGEKKPEVNDGVSKAVATLLYRNGRI